MTEQGLDFAWQKGYGAFGVSASHLERVRAYIRNQREEFLLMLKKAGIPYDPKTVFD